jgi:hypothetical protein
MMGLCRALGYKQKPENDLVKLPLWFWVMKEESLWRLLLEWRKQHYCFQKSYLGRDETIEPGLMHILIHLGS